MKQKLEALLTLTTLEEVQSGIQDIIDGLGTGEKPADEPPVGKGRPPLP